MDSIKKFRFQLVTLLLLNFALMLNTLSAKIGPTLPGPMVVRDAKQIDANQIRMWLINNGTLARHPISGNAGLEYPVGSNKHLIYVAGLWIAGLVDGGIRTACADYNTEYQGGVILPSGKPDDPTLEKYRIYKIKPGDSADPASPNYNKDYAEWPVADGAPLDDNGNPLIIGDQTLWWVMNDGNQTLHDGCYNTLPLNLEVQALAWAIDNDETALGKTVFLHYTIINKSQKSINDAFVGLYVDPDLGHANDDKAACDTAFNLSYDFNGEDFDRVYGHQVPAVGLCVLQGPAVPSPGNQALQFLHQPLQDTQLLKMTVNMIYIPAHLLFSHPPYGSNGAQSLYGNFLGLDRRGDPVTDPTTGQVTMFMYSGDPIITHGWIYEYNSDAYFMQGSGPFFMAPMDTQRVLFAIVVGHGSDRLSSVLDLRKNTDFIRNTIKTELALKVTTDAQSHFLSDTETRLFVQSRVIHEKDILAVQADFYSYHQQHIHSMPLLDDGQVDNGIAGDQIFGNSWDTAASDSVLYVTVTITDNSSQKFQYRYADYNITLSDPTSIDQKKTAAIDDFYLYQNYPNPFNPATTIKFSARKPGQITLKIYNIMGQEIRELLNESVSAGVHSLQWDGRDKFLRRVASGLYFARLRSGDGVKLIKMLLIQ
ncbi:MAG: T9SS type A sorting domain-containing protein [bacterium]|nr:T9SS type A sorting domain-containing protein [bacterium]